MNFKGTKHDDNFTGTGGDDIFNLSQGGDDKASGGNGNDTFVFKGAFTAKDSINGGSGSDTLTLAGDYTGSHAVTFGAKTMAGVETIKLGAHHSYKLTTNDATVARNATLTVDGSKLGASDVLTFNGSHETNGKFDLIGGKGNDALTGGAKNDTFGLTHGGADAANGGGGNDTFNMGAYNSADMLKGGTGNDTAVLTGNGGSDITLDANHFNSIETLLLSGDNYFITAGSDLLTSGQSMTIDASALTAGQILNFNAGSVTGGTYHIAGGASGDVVSADNAALMGGLTFNGGAGNDTLSITGAAGDDTVTFDLSHVTSLEFLTLGGPAYFDLTTGNATVASGATLTVNGAGLDHHLSFDGRAETDGFFHITGGSGDDIIKIGSSAVLSGSTIDGGDGTNNKLVLDGDFSSGPDMSNVSNINTIQLLDGHGYFLNPLDANFATGTTLTVDASALTGGNGLSLDLANVSHDGLIVDGGDADDAVSFYSAAVFQASQVSGGAGNDQINLTHDETITITSGMISNVEKINLNDGFAYNITMDDGTVVNGGSLTIYAANAGSLIFDGWAETGGKFLITDSAGDDTLTGGDKGDTFTLANGGSDTIEYTDASQSTSVNYDTLADFNASSDHIDTPHAVSVVGSTSHSISTATFDSDIGAACGGDSLAGYGGILIAASGDFAGHTFLVVDTNGDAAYTAGTDYVFDVTGYSGSLTAGTFGVTPT